MPEISRVTRSKEEARAGYDRLSKWYDFIAGKSEKQYRDIGLHMLNARLGETILEIGCGTGQATLLLARSVGETGKIYGLDISQGMLSVSCARVRRAALEDRVSLSCGDAASLAFPGSAFDAIFMSFTLELFDTPEIPVVLKECRRVLCSEGRLCVVSMSKKGEASLMTKVYDWGHQRFQSYLDCRPIYAQRAIEDAGFRIVETRVMSMWGLPVEIVLCKNLEGE